MFTTKPCLVIHRDRYYFGTLDSLSRKDEARLGLDHTDVIVVGLGKERFACAASTLVQKQGYTAIAQCPEGTIDCDAVDTGTENTDAE